MLMPILNSSPECSHSLPGTLKEEFYICLLVLRWWSNKLLMNMLISGQYLRNEPLSFMTGSKNRPWDMLVEACPSLSLLKETEMFQPHCEYSLTQEFVQLEAKVKASFAEIPATIGRSAVLPFNIGIGVDCSADQLDKIRVTSHTFNTCKDRCTLLTLTNSAAPSKGL